MKELLHKGDLKKIQHCFNQAWRKYLDKKKVIYRDSAATNLGDKRFLTFEELPWKEKVHNQFVLANEYNL